MYDIIADYDEGVPNPALMDQAVELFRADSYTLMQSKTPGHFWAVFHFKYPVPRAVVIMLLDYVECDEHYIKLVAARGPSIRISDKWLEVRFGKKEGEVKDGAISRRP